MQQHRDESVDPRRLLKQMCRCKTKRRRSAGATLTRVSLSLRRSRYGRTLPIRGVDKILQLLARLEERNFLSRDLHLRPRFRIAAHTPAPLPSPETAKPAYLDLFALLQGLN